MKRFREFIAESKGKKPIVIKAVPTHGGHTKNKSKLEEHYRNPTDSWFRIHDNHHLGTDHEEVGDKLNHTEAHFMNKVGGADNHSHVYDYTEESWPINGRLAKGKGPRTGQEKAMTTALDHATNHPLEHDLHVYHGLDRWDPGKESEKHPEGLVKLPTYLSTSISKTRAHQFSQMRGEHQDIDTAAPGKFNKGHILHIHLKKGDKGLYVGNHSAQTNVTGVDEREFLMPRDTTLKIHHTPTQLNDGVHVWHATVHSHGEEK